MSDTPRTDALLLELNEGRIYADDGPLAVLLREIESELTASQWRPIDTAPKDKRVLFSDGKHFYTGFCDSFIQCIATHWQPLPKPPTEESE